MKILGYSERGMLNSLFYEMLYSKGVKDGLSLLNRFLALCILPSGSREFHINDAQILIEQSFSDFGDADAVLLINHKGLKESVFLEAKVKTDERRSWSIMEEFENFEKGINDKVSSSNLFVQLYHKVRLMKAIRESGIEDLKKGKPVRFPKFSSKIDRKVGKNNVVIKALEMLDQYKSDSYFVGIIPEQDENVRKFVKEKLIKFSPPQDDYWEWDIKNWGFVTWGQVEKYCEKEGLMQTRENFKFNKGQIY